MKRDTARIKPLTSSFLSSEKDTELILKRLFIENQPYCNILKKLLIINTKDCLKNSEYDKEIESFSLNNLIKKGYIRFDNGLKFEEHAEVKNFILLSFDDYIPNAENPHYRDCSIYFDIVCNKDYIYIGDYRDRGFKIVGYIDGLLNETKLTGIGTLNFGGCSRLDLDENLTGYTLMYRAVHGNDDQIKKEDL